MSLNRLTYKFKSVSTFFHSGLKIAYSKFFGLVKDVKHLTHRIEQFLACSRRFDNIRRRGFGGIRRVLRELSNLVCEFGHLIGQLGKLFFECCDAIVALLELRFEFRDTLNVKLFCSGSQVLSSSLLTRLISDKSHTLLEKNIDMPP